MTQTSSDTENGWDQRGKLYDLTAERYVIGALLEAGANESLVVTEILHAIRGPLDFYDPKNAMLYKKIAELVADGQAPHPLTVIGALDQRQLSQCTNGTYVMDCYGLGMASQGTYYARKVREWAAKRDVVQFGIKVNQLATSSPADQISDVIRRIQDEAGELQAGAVRTALVDQNQTNDEVLNYIDAQSQRKPGEMSGVLSGFTDLDRLLQGGQPGQVCVIAGRPGMGKSTAARNWVWHTATQQGLPAAFFSLEMGRMEIGLAMLSAESGVPLNVLRDGTLDELDWTRLARALGHSKDAPLYYDETPGATLEHMEAGLRHVKNLHGSVPIAAFDYLQLAPASARAGNRQEDVSNLSRGMKLLAKKYECFIILVSQLNRGPETRADKRPQLADLRESGSIEQDADIVILLHREDYYDKESPRSGEADFIVAKHRNGPTDTITMAAQLHLSRFVSMAIVD